MRGNARSATTITLSRLLFEKAKQSHDSGESTWFSTQPNSSDFMNSNRSKLVSRCQTPIQLMTNQLGRNDKLCRHLQILIQSVFMTILNPPMVSVKLRLIPGSSPISLQYKIAASIPVSPKPLFCSYIHAYLQLGTPFASSCP